MAAVTETDSVATEHTEEPQLAELLNHEAGLTNEIHTKVVHTQVIEYIQSQQWRPSDIAENTSRLATQNSITVLLGCRQTPEKNMRQS